MRATILILSLALSQSAFASLGDDTITGAGPSQSVFGVKEKLFSSADDSKPIFEALYTVNGDTTVIPRIIGTNGELKQNVLATSFVIKGDQPFAVRTEGDKVFLQPIVAADARGTVPDLFVFKKSDLASVNMRFLEEGNQYTLLEKYGEYVNTDVAVGHCKALVERALGFWVPGGCASSMSGTLPRAGFRKISCGSIGRHDLQVWGGGPGGCGHVAFWTGGNWTSIDYVGNPGHRFYSKGCYSRRDGDSGTQYASRRTKSSRKAKTQIAVRSGGRT